MTRTGSGRHCWFNAKGRRNFEEFALPRGPQRYLEIGVFEGDSLFWVLDNCRPPLAVAIDPYPADSRRTAAQTRAIGDRVAERLRGYPGARLFREPSRDVLPRLYLDGAGFDFVYIDGSHTGPDVLFDAVAGWSLLAPGGLMIFDDWRVRAMRHVAGLRDAIASFVRINATSLRVLAVNAQVVVERRPTPGAPDPGALDLASHD